MFGSGKNKEVIIKVLPRVYETQPSMFGGGGIVTLEYDRLAVWAEHGFKSAFLKIPGVFKVDEDDPEPRYVICIDPRFDTKWVMAEIEAAALINKPTKKKAQDESRGGFFYAVLSPEQPKKRKKKGEN